MALPGSAKNMANNSAGAISFPLPTLHLRTPSPSLVCHCGSSLTLPLLPPSLPGTTGSSPFLPDLGEDGSFYISCAKTL